MALDVYKWNVDFFSFSYLTELGLCEKIDFKFCIYSLIFPLQQRYTDSLVQSLVVIFSIVNKE